MVYGMAWQAWHVYDMVWRVWHGIWYDLVGITRYMLCGLADIAWYMVWSGEVCHGMWKGIVLHALRHCHGL